MPILRHLLILLGWLGALSVAAPASAAAPGMEPVDQTVCRLIERAAQANGLPVGFFTRIIWRESSFRAGAVSPAGAQGIAQFMPGTAQARGLADPFDPEQAIPKSARLLADLRRHFGNLGLAAAAYNAGAGRVADWLAGHGGLPRETRNYVQFVTARAADDWQGSGSSNPTAPVSATDNVDDTSCLALSAQLRRSGNAPVEAAIWAPWGVQLAGNFSKALALATFQRAAGRYAAVIGDTKPMIIGRVLRSRGTRPFYQIRLPAPTRDAAQAVCNRIQSVGGACIAVAS
jgi:hypothetical protein